MLVGKQGFARSSCGHRKIQRVRRTVTSVDFDKFPRVAATRSGARESALRCASRLSALRKVTWFKRIGDPVAFGGSRLPSGTCGTGSARQAEPTRMRPAIEPCQKSDVLVLWCPNRIWERGIRARRADLV